MNKSISYGLRVCALLFWLAGCAENKYIRTTEQICPPAVTKADSTSSPQADAITIAESVLAEMHFTIEKLDAETGFIRTNPLSGAQTFELWRTDSVGSFNRAEADLHSIRRTVELNVIQQSGQFCINCKATTQRLSLPQNQNAAGQGILSQTRLSAQKLKLSPEQKTNPTWIDLGRDSQLETEILKRIEKQLSRTKKEQIK
ncbi:MAG: hypothetical protein MUO27_00435 [Sedimentisphaerales bacterium]|nr:hypothetical protein [Sedimentisphaerales bacterium]